MINKPLITVQSGTNNNIICHNIQLEMPRMLHSLFMLSTIHFEILEIIKNRKNKKSTGHDKLSTDLIKNIAKHIMPVLTHTVNLSFSVGIFPDKLKQCCSTIKKKNLHI